MTAGAPGRRTVLVTLCTYNERENIEKLISAIHVHAPDADILVLDDNSPDGTANFARELALRDQRVGVLVREARLGLGTAIVTALRYGVDHGYEFVVNMDSDFSHDPRYVPDLRAAMARVDVAVASRYIPGGRIEGWGLSRHFSSRAVNWYARLLLGLKTRDNSGSFRCYRTASLRKVDFDRVRARGYAIQEELLYRLKQVGCRFEEVPIVFAKRRYGRSKMGFGEAPGALWVIFRLWIDRLMRVPVAVADGPPLED